jgi:hypothetical protein
MQTPKKSRTSPEESLFAFKSPAPSHFKQKMGAVGHPYNQFGARDQSLNPASILGRSPHMLNKSRFGDST